MSDPEEESVTYVSSWTDDIGLLWGGLGICLICLGIGGCNYLVDRGAAVRNAANRIQMAGDKIDCMASNMIALVQMLSEPEKKP